VNKGYIVAHVMQYMQHSSIQKFQSL